MRGGWRSLLLSYHSLPFLSCWRIADEETSQNAFKSLIITIFSFPAASIFPLICYGRDWRRSVDDWLFSSSIWPVNLQLSPCRPRRIMTRSDGISFPLFVAVKKARDNFPILLFPSSSFLKAREDDGRDGKERIR